jgi:hypothetical protein
VQVFNRISEHLLAAVKEFIKEHPALAGIERPALKQALEKGDYKSLTLFFDDILSVMKQKGLLQLDSNIVALPGRERKLEGELAKHAEGVEEAYRSGALGPPSRAEIETNLKIPQKTLREIWTYLHDTKKLVDASADVTFHREHIEGAKAKLRNCLRSRKS